MVFEHYINVHFGWRRTTPDRTGPMIHRLAAHCEVVESLSQYPTWISHARRPYLWRHNLRTCPWWGRHNDNRFPSERTHLLGYQLENPIHKRLHRCHKKPEICRRPTKPSSIFDRDAPENKYKSNLFGLKLCAPLDYLKCPQNIEVENRDNSN